MADTKDLKSFGQKCPCEFDSHLWYNFVYTKFFVVNELDILKFVDVEEETKQTAKQTTRKMYQKRK